MQFYIVAYFDDIFNSKDSQLLSVIVRLLLKIIAWKIDELIYKEEAYEIVGVC